jgi:hypothetical protein
MPACRSTAHGKLNRSDSPPFDFALTPFDFALTPFDFGVAKLVKSFGSCAIRRKS